MKKTPCSIGTYVLKEVEFLTGHEGGGFEAELWKGQKFIGTLEDWGDGGGVNARFNPALSQEQRTLLGQELLKDMKELQEVCNADKDCLGELWTNTPYGAMEGFGELLLELTDLVKMFKTAKKKYPNAPFVVVQTGEHWFLETGNSFQHTGYYSMHLLLIDKKDYDKVVKQALKKQHPNTKISLLKYISDDFKWSLSFKDYALLMESAKKVMDYKLKQ